jgi:hypothetical protein
MVINIIGYGSDTPCKPRIYIAPMEGKNDSAESPSYAGGGSSRSSRSRAASLNLVFSIDICSNSALSMLPWTFCSANLCKRSNWRAESGSVLAPKGNGIARFSGGGGDGDGDGEFDDVGERETGGPI